MLSHEPHFSLLREEIRFGRKNQKRAVTPDTATFHLLHLSIMRECLDFEFGGLKVRGRARIVHLPKLTEEWCSVSLVANIISAEVHS